MKAETKEEGGGFELGGEGEGDRGEGITRRTFAVRKCFRDLGGLLAVVAGLLLHPAVCSRQDRWLHRGPCRLRCHAIRTHRRGGLCGIEFRSWLEYKFQSTVGAVPRTTTAVLVSLT